MTVTSFFSDLSANGYGGRVSLAATILVYLIVYNETTAPCVLWSTFLATAFGLLAVYHRSVLKHLQMPYLRASNKCDFVWLFLATWMDTLAILCACAILARTLSMCLDAMTSGIARIMILGRNSPSNEPWPDVLGVTVIFLVTGMFMLGLEHSKAFSLIMALAMLGLNVLLSIVSWWRKDLKSWQELWLQPNGLESLCLSSALLVFCFPNGPLSQHNTTNRCQRFIGSWNVLITTLSIILTAICLSTLTHYKKLEEYVAMPLSEILNEHDFHKLIPAAACLLMLVASGALLELFPEFYGLIVRFASSEWKILTKQIGYESSESGNPVLAVFIAGSLCAMLAFACPLLNLTHLLASSHITGVFLRALYALYSPFRPRFIIPQQMNNDSYLSYSRLANTNVGDDSSNLNIPSRSSTMSSSCGRKKTLWKISIPSTKKVVVPPLMKKQHSKSMEKQELEKEWLLLGEPTSPCPQREPKTMMESTILSDDEPTPSDFEYPDKVEENSDSDTSTDIDAIVDEYRQKIKVTTSDALDHGNNRLPTLKSWRLTQLAIVIVFVGVTLTWIGIQQTWLMALIGGGGSTLLMGILMCFLPKYTFPGGGVANISGSGNSSSSGGGGSCPPLNVLTILLAIVHFMPTASNSWPGVVFWLLAGFFLATRCDRVCLSCCCSCCCCCSDCCLGDVGCDDDSVLNEQLIPKVLVRGPAKRKDRARMATKIVLPRPPKGLLTIPQCISGHATR